MIRRLADSISDAAAAGDIAAAKVAYAALGDLLGVGQPEGGSADVVPLRSRESS